jgi:glycosyltransferase involved in cell wall biosynthesis
MSKPESEEIKRVPLTNGAKAVVVSETSERQKEHRAEVGIPMPPVLFMADHFGYPDGVSHGVTTYFLQIIPALLNAGIDLTACFLREPHAAAEELHQYGVKPIFLSARAPDPSVVFRVAAIAKQRGCGIIHASQIKATLAARVVAPIVGARTIVHVHDLIRPGHVVSNLHRLFSRRSDLGLCVSHAVESTAVEGYHVRADRIRVVYNGIRLERFRSVLAGTKERLRKDLGIPQDSMVLGMVGRMYPVKGHRAMLRMMVDIKRRCPAAVLMLAGDGPERAACERLSDELQIRGAVRFLGQRKDIPELLSISDLVVMPSESEGLAMAAIESLAAGRPIVAFAVGGLVEVVDDAQSGRLIEPKDFLGFVDAVVSLLTNRETLSAYSAHALVVAERFSIECHIRELLNCYRLLTSADG